MASALSIISLLTPWYFFKKYKTAGKTPEDPQVGAVTTIFEDAFSSATASA